MRLDPEAVRRVVAAALEEDLNGAGDITTAAVIDGAQRATARIVARQQLVLAGLPVAREVFVSLDRDLEFRAHHADGEEIPRGRTVATLCGRAAPILTGERTALNLLMRMSGIATATRAALDEVAGTGVKILDTRKTAPGLRLLDKYAVAAAGGVNHRLGLYDAVMIKDTHLDSGCSIRQAVARARERGHPPDAITVEVADLAQLEEAIDAGAGRVLLDNMSLEALGQAVRAARGRVELEASGGLRPGALRSVAATGVDWLSVGWLTHSAPAADLALELEPAP